MKQALCKDSKWLQDINCVAKFSILNVCGGPGHASDCHQRNYFDSYLNRI